ncbi:MAG: DUF2309 domain-containing protein [Parvularcula sp.]|nr:DUF2309 domain-containing protein [Parvularcula sp.]
MEQQANHTFASSDMASETPSVAPARDVSADALEAAARIAPLWPLADFVAVNPMQGLTAMGFSKAGEALRQAGGRGLLMPWSYYLAAFERGEFGLSDIEAALGDFAAEGRLSATKIVSSLKMPEAEEQATPLPTFSDALSAARGEELSGFVTDQITFWASSYFDQGQSLWRNPWANERPYVAWREQAAVDRSPDRLGLAEVRSCIAALPEDPGTLLKHAIDVLRVPESSRVAYFHRLLSTVAGWAGHLRYLGWQDELAGGAPTKVIDLLAIRLAYDLALHKGLGTEDISQKWREDLRLFRAKRDETAERVAQRAFEIAYQDRLLGGMTSAASLREPEGRPSVQAVFCIDVRSERFRRALEAADPAARTYGFAGFFGLPLAIKAIGQENAQAQCPVLLTPAYELHEACDDLEAREKALTRRAVLAAWKKFKNAAISSFAFVEAMGVGFLAALVTDSAKRPAPERRSLGDIEIEHHACGQGTGIALADRVALAEGMMAGMSLGDNLARIVLLAGHGAHTTNNPYASGLDCGACGGHAGDSNARVAAGILNDPEVRQALAEKGKVIPDDTVFLAGLHDTVTDEVTIFGGDELPATHTDDLTQLKRHLDVAGTATRRERASGLHVRGSRGVDRAVQERGRDWSQVRPEWGLAGCASFIAAPRERTRGVDLSGRAFLHSFDWRADEDNAILELIMTAPLVVASWINLQYYASTVNNEAFGSGDKTLHNVVGGFGVLEGISGDLRSGLPLQSVHDGAEFFHTPLRLTAVIEAPRSRIDAVLQRHAHVADLFDRDWLSLIAIEEDGKRYLRYVGGGRWEHTEIPAFSRKDAA